jgi:hypothetical protein
VTRGQLLLDTHGSSAVIEAMPVGVSKGNSTARCWIMVELAVFVCVGLGMVG